MTASIQAIEDCMNGLKEKLASCENSLRSQKVMLKKSQDIKSFLDKNNIVSTLSGLSIIIDINNIIIMREVYEAKLVITFAQTAKAETYISGSYRLKESSVWYDIKTSTNKIMMKRVTTGTQLLKLLKNFNINIPLYIAHVNMLDRNIACNTHQIRYRSMCVDPTESYDCNSNN